MLDHFLDNHLYINTYFHYSNEVWGEQQLTNCLRFVADENPGYRFKIVDRLMTNFHLPKSTLFMLVSAFAGLERMQAAYAHAIAGGYRFYSYGDSSLLERA